MSQRIELDIPANVQTAEKAFEMLRVWAADGGQHVSIATGVWQDPAACGLALADLARHIARAYEATEGISAEEALARIRKRLEAKLLAPTDLPKGGVLD